MVLSGHQRSIHQNQNSTNSSWFVNGNSEPQDGLHYANRWQAFRPARGLGTERFRVSLGNELKTAK